MSLARALAPLASRVLGGALRAVIRLVDDAPRAQELQIEAFKGQLTDGVERFQEYGLSTVPPAGSEAIVIALGGARDHAVVVATESREHRPRGLAPGEVQLYAKWGQRVHLRADGSIELGAGSSSIRIADGEITLTAAAITMVEAT